MGQGQGGAGCSGGGCQVESGAKACLQLVLDVCHLHSHSLVHRNRSPSTCCSSVRARLECWLSLGPVEAQPAWLAAPTRQGLNSVQHAQAARMLPATWQACVWRKSFWASDPVCYNSSKGSCCDVPRALPACVQGSAVVQLFATHVTVCYSGFLFTNNKLRIAVQEKQT